MRRRLLDTTRGARMWWGVVFRNPMTTTLRTWHGGVLTMPCPSWCAGHPGAEYPEHPADLTHTSVDVGLTVVTAERTFEVLAVGIAQAPLSTRRSGLPYLTADLGSAGFTRVTPDEVLALADGLERHAVFLRQFAADFEPLRSAAAEAMRPAGIPKHLPPLAPLDGEL
jgi:hypothetical protein